MEQTLDSILGKYTSQVENHLQGTSFVAVNNKGQTIYSKAFGNRTFETSQAAPLQTNSTLSIYSLTKLITSVAALVAVEKGLITLDQNVREIVPELKDLELLVGFEDRGCPRRPILRKASSPISLRQLLSHQSGFTYDQLHPGLQEWSKYNGRAEWTMSASMGGYTHPLIFEPGSSWAYGCGMDWAGRTIETVSGQTLENFMQTHIFSPLSISNTTFHPELRPDLLSNLMEMGFRDRSTGTLNKGVNPWTFPAKDCCGGVGMYSTTEDYAKLLKALLMGGSPILSQESVEEILTSQLDDPEKFTRVVNGLGRAHLGQTWPEGENQGTFGLSSSINLEGFPGRRAKGSANWSGMPGLHAWLDRETGVAGLLTTQVLPPGDPMVTKCLLELETALYKCLREETL